MSKNSFDLPTNEIRRQPDCLKIKSDSKGIEIPLKSLYGRPPEILFHPNTPEGQGADCWLNRESVSIVESSIFLFYLWTVDKGF